MPWHRLPRRRPALPWAKRKKIYVYDNLKITFTGGKVTSAE